MGIYAIEEPLYTAFILAFFLLIAFPVHEFFHAWTAYKLGDGTAKLFGKLTLNPIAHFHPIGGWMLVLSTVVFGIPLGFAATPVNPSNLRGRYGDAYVALAGPLSNFLVAAVFAIPLRIMLSGDLVFQYPEVANMLFFVVRFSLLLGLFNLIPIPPLDGGTVLLSVVSRQLAWQLRPFFNQYGMILVVAAIFFGGRFLLPIVDAIYGILVGYKVRQFRSHLGARVAADERHDLAAWLTAPQLDLFDAMHVADRRHGLDVAATLRAEGVTDPDVLLAGLLHDAGKGSTGVSPRVAYSLGQRYGRWTWRLAGIVPGWRVALERLRDHAVVSAELAARAGCSELTVTLIRDQDAPSDPRFGELLRLADEAN